MTRLLSVAALLLAGVAVAASLWMARAVTGPFSETQLAGHEIGVTDAGVRLMITGEFDLGEAGKRRGFCIEPSPDVAAEASAALSALASGKAGAEGAGAAETAISRGAADRLLERSQGIQALRDMIFQACVARMNGLIDEERYTYFLNAAITGGIALSAAELLAGEHIETEEALLVARFVGYSIDPFASSHHFDLFADLDPDLRRDLIGRLGRGTGSGTEPAVPATSRETLTLEDIYGTGSGASSE